MRAPPNHSLPRKRLRWQRRVRRPGSNNRPPPPRCPAPPLFPAPRASHRLPSRVPGPHWIRGKIPPKGKRRPPPGTSVRRFRMHRFRSRPRHTFQNLPHHRQQSRAPRLPATGFPPMNGSRIAEGGTGVHRPLRFNPPLRAPAPLGLRRVVPHLFLPLKTPTPSRKKNLPESEAFGSPSPAEACF